MIEQKQKIIITDDKLKGNKRTFYKDVENSIYWSYSESNKYFDNKLEGIV